MSLRTFYGSSIDCMHTLSDFLDFTEYLPESFDAGDIDQYLARQYTQDALLRLQGSTSDNLYTTPSISSYPSVFPIVKDATNIPMQFGPPFSIGGLQFRSPFHYYYFMKAHIFGDTDTAKKILEYDDGYWGPDWRELQKMASHVKGFNNDIWKKCHIRIAYKACKHKILSDPYALRDLLSTYGKCLSWYMPNEPIWGYVNCGEDWFNINNIHGENRMGNVLNLLRDDIIAVIENNWEWELQNVPPIVLNELQYESVCSKHYFYGNDICSVEIKGYIYIMNKGHFLDRLKFEKQGDDKYYMVKMESAFASRLGHQGQPSVIHEALAGGQL